MEKDINRAAAGLLKNKDAISRLAQTEDAQRLMQLLQQDGDVEQAAQEAASGAPNAILKRLKQLMNTQEGGKLIQRIHEQAKKDGLTE